MPFRRSRESRTREAAGRRNWLEAVPRKMRGRKRQWAELSEDQHEGDPLQQQTNQPEKRKAEVTDSLINGAACPLSARVPFAVQMDIKATKEAGNAGLLAQLQPIAQLERSQRREQRLASGT